MSQRIKVIVCLINTNLSKYNLCSWTRGTGLGFKVECCFLPTTGTVVASGFQIVWGYEVVSFPIESLAMHLKDYIILATWQKVALIFNGRGYFKKGTYK